MTFAAIQDDIFRAYDIRGIVGEGLNAEIMFCLGEKQLAVRLWILVKIAYCLVLMPVYQVLSLRSK